MCGLCDALVFKSINGNDIDSVEKFIREELFELWKIEAVKLPYGTELKDAFGELFANNPGRFKFVPGERKLIGILVTYVNNLDPQRNLPIAGNNKPVNSPTSIEPVDQSVQHTKYFLDKLQSVGDINLKKVEKVSDLMTK